MYLAHIVGIFLLLVLLLIFVIRLSTSKTQVRVLPFLVAAGEDKLCGRALADLFLAEWRRILFYQAEKENLDVRPVWLAGKPGPSK